MKMHVAAGFMTPLLLLAGAASADGELEGRIMALDATRGMLVLDGVTLQTGPGTDYDDDLRDFYDLHVGQRVEVDYVYRDGVRYVTEIELDD